MAIHIEKVGKKIQCKPTSFLGGDRFKEYLAATKLVPGCIYNKTQKCQTAPLDIEVCHIFRRVFGPDLIIGPELQQWYRDNVGQAREALATLRLDLTKEIELSIVPQVAPYMYEAMQQRGYQPLAAKFGALVGNHINADAPGLGKSIESFGAMIEAGRRGKILLVGPRTSLRATWKHEIEKWLTDLPGGVSCHIADAGAPDRHAVVENFVEMETDHYFDFLLINAEMARLSERYECKGDPANCEGTNPYCDYLAQHKTYRLGAYEPLFRHPWDLVVGDEVHKYMVNANPRASKNRISQVGLGLMKLPAAGGGVEDGLRRLALTGTPMKGKPRLVWPILHWLKPSYYTSEGRFKEQYLRWKEDSYAYGGKKFLDEVRADRAEAFHTELNRTMLRRTKEELRAINPNWAPPAKMYHNVLVTLDPKQREQYKKILKDSLVQFEAEDETMLVNGPLASRTRLLQFAKSAGRVVGGEFRPCMPSAHIDWLVDYLLPRLGITGAAKTLDQGDEKVVVASHHAKFIELVKTQLNKAKIPSHMLTGATPDEERMRMVQEFQAEGGPRLFLLSTTAGGVSITLDAANTCVIFDETDNPDDQLQVEDRVHRTSNVDHQVNIYYVRAEDTIQQVVYETNRFKDREQTKHLEGRRGVTVKRQGIED